MLRQLGCGRAAGHCRRRDVTHALARRALATRAFEVEGGLTQLARGELPAVGVEASVTHTFALADTVAFAELSGDSNPIHTTAPEADDAPIVQGMLSASLFATIFGRTIPGAVYVSQTLRWRAPLLVGEAVRARIRVVRLRKRFVDCETLCEKIGDGSIIVEGTATVLLPPPPTQV